jgi:hypothetical protein
MDQPKHEHEVTILKGGLTTRSCAGYHPLESNNTSMRTTTDSTSYYYVSKWPPSDMSSKEVKFSYICASDHKYQSKHDIAADLGILDTKSLRLQRTNSDREGEYKVE